MGGKAMEGYPRVISNVHQRYLDYCLFDCVHMHLCVCFKKGLTQGVP